MLVKWWFGPGLLSVVVDSMCSYSVVVTDLFVDLEKVATSVILMQTVKILLQHNRKTTMALVISEGGSTL